MLSNEESILAGEILEGIYVVTGDTTGLTLQDSRAWTDGKLSISVPKDSRIPTSVMLNTGSSLVTVFSQVGNEVLVLRRGKWVEHFRGIVAEARKALERSRGSSFSNIDDAHLF